MKAPDNIKVGYRVYDVTIDKDAINACAANNAAGFGHYGECNHEQLVITVDPDQADLMIRETILHEILHACCSITGIADELGDKLEESVVMRLSPVIMGFLEDNPKTVAYLTGKTNGRTPR